MSASVNHQENHIFLSYSHLDADRIKSFRTEMEKQSVPYWYDYNLHFGGTFSNEIAYKIKTCYAFILFLSQNSSNSWYVFDELTYARNKGKRVIVIHLEPDVNMSDGMELLLGSLHHILNDLCDNVHSCIARIVSDLKDGNINNAQPVLLKKLNHNSNLLVNCRRSLEHTASQMGVHDIDNNIDRDFFCPIYHVEENSNQQAVEIYSEICKSDHTHILLQAEGGLGKTYTFLYTMKRLLDCDRPCAYIPCHLFNDSNQHDLGLILSTVCRMLLINSGSETELNRFLVDQTDKEFILFLDGYNEAVAKGPLKSEIIHISTVFPNIKIVVSSRYNDSVFSNYSHYTMKGLNRNDVKKLLAQNGRDYRSLNYGLQNLLLTPMFLRLYLQMGSQPDKWIDTAAELMDQERRRVLETVRLSSLGNSIDGIEKCLNYIFPEFVRLEYCTKDRSMSFYGEYLEAFLNERISESISGKACFDFLTAYSIIMKTDDRTNTYTYRHEHFRDYWVAYSVFQNLLHALRYCKGYDRVTAIIRTLNEDYSQTVLRYIGELAQVSEKDNLLAEALDCVRRSTTQNDSLWLSDDSAKVTAKIIDIYKLVLNENIVGMNFSELNLSFTQLNRAKTCTSNNKAVFRGSLIEEKTFVVSMHESAPRRVEILRLNEKLYLITISNTDLLISTLPDLDTVWRYPHIASDGSFITTHDLTTSVILGPCILGVDVHGAVWEWNFIYKDDVPVALPILRHAEAEPAQKVISWSDDLGQTIALQKKDGSILQYVNVCSSQNNTEELVLSPEEPIAILPDIDTNKTLTASHLHDVIFLAVSQNNEVHVWKHNVRDGSNSVLCVIPDNGIPDYMICVGTEQASRKSNKIYFGATELDGTVLILAVLHKSKTTLYQINLPMNDSAKANYVKLQWYNAAMELGNDYKMTERQYNKINAASFANGKMLLAASDGCLYSYLYDNSLQCYIPDMTAPKVRVSSAKFSVEDVLFVPANRIGQDVKGDNGASIEVATVSIDRSVHLLEAESLFHKRKLHGYNDGLRHLLPVDDMNLIATSYDGCLLKLNKAGNKWRLKSKIPIGNWCWVAEKISASVYAVGYMTGIALINVSTDETLCKIDGFEQKVESILYLRDINNSVIVASKDASRVYQINENNREMRLEYKGKMSLPKNAACYWIERCDNLLFLSINTDKESDPRIAYFDLTLPLIEQNPKFLNPQSKFGRIRDIHCFSHYMMVSGLCGNDGNEKSSQVKFFDLLNLDKPVLPITIEGFQSFIVHSAIRTDGEKNWRVAVIDLQSKGQLYQYIINISEDDVLSVVLIAEHTFPTKLCDVAFDENGDLLLTALNGALYRKQWNGDETEVLFRNKCYMLTFGTDMSDLYKPVKLQSHLGQILSDFNNQLEKINKGTRVIR